MSCVQLLQIPLAASIDETWTLSKDPARLTENLRKATGIESIAWAPRHEDSKIAGIAAHWNTYDDYLAWCRTSGAEALKSLVAKIAAGSVYKDVVVFPESAAPTLKAAVVELVSWIHPTSKIDEKLKKDVLNGFAIFAEAIKSRAPEANGGSIGGWGELEFEHGGTPSRRFIALIGWKSVEAHFECKKTEPFLENIHHLMEHGHTGTEMVHYAFANSAGPIM